MKREQPRQILAPLPKSPAGIVGLDEITQVEKLAVDMETGLRGYRITANPIFLEPFDHATPIFPENMVSRFASLLKNDGRGI